MARRSKNTLRKSSRRASRKDRRSSRRASRKGRRSSRMMYGGAAPVGNASMTPMSQQSLAQGGDYLSMHKEQHGGSSCGMMQRGGAAVSLAAAAPVGYTGMLDDSLRGVARVAPLDQDIAAIQGMRDQSGGARRRKASRRGRSRSYKAAARRITKRARASMMKVLRSMRRKLRMRGGAALQPADYSAPGMLLSPADQTKALMGMNPEWKLAADPTSFAPK